MIKVCKEGITIRKVTQIVICAAAVLLITLAMITGETWKDKIVISLAVLIFTGFSLVWNTFVINLMEKFNRKRGEKMRPFKRMRTIYLITVPIIALLSLFFPQSLGDRILTFFFVLVFGGLAIGFTYLMNFINEAKDNRG